MKENIVQKLTSKDDKYACAFTDRIVAESHDTDEWYEYFEDVTGSPATAKSSLKSIGQRSRFTRRRRKPSMQPEEPSCRRSKNFGRNTHS